VNGKSQGRKKRGEFEYRFRWDDVIYEPGELKVETWKLGQPWATSTIKTADTPARLEATPDRDTIRADGVDLSFVTVRITDAQGTPAPRAMNRITFRIEGPGEIVATDNGDPTNLEPFGSPERAAFNGLCLAIVRSRPGQSGTITLHAQVEELTDAIVEIRTIRP
jgi:beta-galactosidase